MDLDLNSEVVWDITELVRAAQTVEFKQAPAEPKDVYYMCRGGQMPERIVAEPKPRNVRCFSITGACETIRELASVGDVGDAAPFVYVSEFGVHAHMDEDGDRRDIVTMPLTKTDQMKAVEELCNAPVGQAKLVWMLRSTLAGCCLHPDFPVIVRRLRVKSNEDGERSIAVGRESIGSAVVKEMAGIEGSLPELVQFSVPVYEEVWHDTLAGQRHTETVELAVHIDLAEMAFVFKPTGSSAKDALLNARRQALIQFREKLGAAATVLEESSVK